MNVPKLNWSGAGDVLRDLRLQYGHSAADASRHLGILPVYVSRLESGKRQVCLNVLHIYSKKYNIPMSVLLDRIIDRLGLDPLLSRQSQR